MIQKIRESRYTKGVTLLLVVSFLLELFAPTRAFALTGGPAQPEFNSFTPIGTSDMVNLSSGDMSYNIPLMDVGGYPLNLAYNSGITMDQEASWVGLGWDLAVGQINRNVRGLPDDFKGDEMNYKNNVKDNVTVGANFNLTPEIFGFQLPTGDVGASVGLSLNYNNYSGFSTSLSSGINADLGANASIGFNVSSSQSGLSLSPNLSIHQKAKKGNEKLNNLGVNVGTSFNSRKGIEAVSLNMTRKNMVENKKGKLVTKGSSSVGSTISYLDNTYTPSIRQKMNTHSFTVNAALGLSFFGSDAEGNITAYGTVQSLANSEKDKTVYAYGYENTELAPKKDVVLDFNREKDGNVSVNTTNLPITNYTHDIYSVKGEGVSGTYRPHRNQVGYVFDSEVRDLSAEGTIGVEVAGGNAVKWGGDVEGTLSTSRSGMYGGLLGLTQLTFLNPAVGVFSEKTNNNKLDYEKVEFRNMGDLSSDGEINLFNTHLGGYKAVRLKMGGFKFFRSIAKSYENANTSIVLPSNIKRSGRYIRNQSILNISVGELEKGIGNGPVAKNGLGLPSEAKKHHTGEVQITRNDGARYVYGLPVYNKLKKETTFAVNSNGDCQNGLVSYSGNDNSVDNDINDKYFNQITTPGYAHTYLLTSILSTDYQDLNDDGPTIDDLGTYTKFTYINKSSNYRWRVPYKENKATYNEGLKTNLEDDRGNYTYGEKELKYVDKIETKTHVARFFYSERQDARGVKGENGGLDDTNASQASYKLDSVSLYALPEYNALDTAATPIKTAHFVYNYDLCQGIPNNMHGITNELSNKGGKLTLKNVYFTYRDSRMGKYSGYTFDYGNISSSYHNPKYNGRAYDSWGNFKPNQGGCAVMDPVPAPEFNFTDQTSLTNQYAQAWSLQKINLPSGGEINFDYESDDYAYVQNKQALKMFKVVGAGEHDDLSDPSNFNSLVNTDILYDYNFSRDPFTHLFVEVDSNYASSGADFYNHYIKPLEKTKIVGETNKKTLIQFRFFLNMTKSGAVDASGNMTDESSLNNTKYDYVSGYAEIDPEGTYDVYTHPNNGKTYASISVKFVKKEGGTNSNESVNQISKAGWQFGRKYLPKDVYSTNPNGAPPASQGTIAQIAEELVSPTLLNNLFEIFEGPNGRLERNFIAQRFVKDKSWVRLVEPSGKKKGGGVRVKELTMSDVWTDMTGNPNTETMHYGQRYEYELENGKSSGVATYEPVGNKENPFVMPVLSTTEHMLAPDDENYVEKPFGESFFPNPQVTYSRVRVSNLAAGTNSIQDTDIKQLNKTGHVVTEFYTSKDYPTIVDQTEMDYEEDKTNMVASLLNITNRKHFTATQGYMVHTNDMNGKERSKRVYAEGQSDYISGVDYRYNGFKSNDPNTPFSFASHNVGKLDNKVKVILPDGTITERVIGVEYDVVNDFRENESKTKTTGVNMNANGFFVGFIPGLVPSGYPDFSSSSDKFKSAVTTKVVHTYGILKETVAHDAGASVYTRNLAWDGITGEVLVTETVDEYNDKYYSLNYPAHWNYDKMGPASENLGIEGEIQNISGNVYQIQGIGPLISSNYLVEGDEIWVKNGATNKYAWVESINSHDFSLIDRNGFPVNISGLSEFRIIRSGRRNLQSAGISNFTLLKNPLENLNGGQLSNITDSYLVSTTNDNWRIIDAGAVEYSDDWSAQCDCGFDVNKFNYNPFVRNERGVWRTKSSYTYLTGRNNANNPTPRVQGVYSSFSPYYKHDSQSGWTKSPNNWTFTQEVSKFSQFGNELENADALDRYSSAQYGYANKFPVAVAANAKYSEIGFDGFEDYSFYDRCDGPSYTHFNFIDDGAVLTDKEFHTGRYSTVITPNNSLSLSKDLVTERESCLTFKPESGKKYWISAWVKEDIDSQTKNYDNTELKVLSTGGTTLSINFHTTGDIIEGWQRIVGEFSMPNNANYFELVLINNSGTNLAYFDDVRIHPYNASMKSYVYDPETFRLMSELDDNNYATFYEYDKEGKLIRIKKETSRGVKTIQESRSRILKKDL